MSKPKRTPPLPPSTVALDGDFRHQHIHTRGIRLHAVTAGVISDPLIVLLHDSCGGWFDFRHVIAELAAQGFHVAALDLRGYGMSDKPPTGYDHRHVVGDVAGTIRTLGHNSAYVYGAGSGASIAWLLAAAYPDHVDKILTIGAIHPMDYRRAILRKPWLFTDTLPFTGFSRLPAIVRKSFNRSTSGRIARQFRLHTAKDFHSSKAYQENLELRQKAARIGATENPRAKTARYLVNVPPVKWIPLRVSCPVHLLTDSGHQSHLLLRCAASRVEGDLSSTMVHTGRLPHVEDPPEFVRLLSGLLSHAE